MPNNNKTAAGFLAGKSQHTIELFDHFIDVYNAIGTIELHATKTMTGASNTSRGVVFLSAPQRKQTPGVLSPIFFAAMQLRHI